VGCFPPLPLGGGVGIAMCEAAGGGASLGIGSRTPWSRVVCANSSRPWQEQRTEVKGRRSCGAAQSCGRLHTGLMATDAHRPGEVRTHLEAQYCRLCFFLEQAVAYGATPTASGRGQAGPYSEIFAMLRVLAEEDFMSDFSLDPATTFICGRR